MIDAVGLPLRSAKDYPAPQPMELTDRLVLSAVILALLFFPFINILHFALPVRDVVGKSGWLVGETAILILAYVLATRPWSSRDLWEQRFVLVAAMMVFGVAFVRSATYGESLVPINFRFVVLGIVSISISTAFIRRGARDILTIVLCAQGFLVALLIYANMNYFPTVRIASDASGLTGIIFDGERTRSMLINASIGSNAIVASMFVLVAWIKSRRASLDTLGKHVALWATLLFMAYCVSLTGTRYPMLASGAALVLAFWFLPKRLSLLGIAIAAPLLAVLPVLIDFAIAVLAQLDFRQVVGPPNGPSGTSMGVPNLGRTLQPDALPIWRLEQGSGGRVEKLFLALTMIANGPLNLLIGASSLEIRTTQSVGGVVFSDNSFGTILLEIGVPAGLFLIGTSAAYLGRYTKNLLGICFAAYFVGALCFTNAILWDSWFVSVFFMFPVICALGRPHSVVADDQEQSDKLTDFSGARA